MDPESRLVSGLASGLALGLASGLVLGLACALVSVSMPRFGVCLGFGLYCLVSLARVAFDVLCSA